MANGKGIRKLALLGLLGVPALLVACSSGVSKADLDAAKKQADDAQAKVTALQQQLSAKTQESADLQKKLADAQKAPSSSLTLISSKLIPPPPPPPTATPRPAGAPTPTPRVPPASYSQPAGPFFFYVETLTSGHSGILADGKNNLVSADGQDCVKSGIFKRGMNLVWRFEVLDVAAGKRLTDQDGATITLRLPNGEEKTARFSQRAGGREPSAPWMWSVGWNIPMDYPLGGLNYTINVKSKDGRTMTWTEPYLNLPGVEDSRIQIIQ